MKQQKRRSGEVISPGLRRNGGWNMEEKLLLEQIEANQNRLFEILSELVRVDSQNFGPHGNERNMAAKVSEMAGKLGLPADVYSPLDVPGLRECPDYFPGRNLEDRLNAAFMMRGEQDANGLLLMAHNDTVPIGDAESWKVDPLGGEIIDGKIYGRGAGDDKYAIAVGLYLFELLMKNGFKPKKNLIFCTYCDEEYGGSHGALAGCMKTPSERVVNMDGEAMEIWNCAAGGGDVALDFRVNGAVSSADHAAHLLPIVMEELDAFGERRKSEMRANENYRGSALPDESLMYLEIRCGNDGNDLGDGHILFEYFTDKSETEIQRELDDMVRKINLRFADKNAVCYPCKKTTRHFHYGKSDAGCRAITDLQDAARRTVGRELPVVGSCLSDLSVILKYGSPDAFGFGVAGGFSDEGGAHQKNECVDCAKLVEYTKIIGAYVLECVG